MRKRKKNIVYFQSGGRALHNGHIFLLMTFQLFESHCASMSLVISMAFMRID